MNTRAHIIQLADTLIRDKGYNAFSYHDIAKTIGIKPASIHYHFPVKSNLGVAVIEKQIDRLFAVIEKYKSKSAVERLDKFLSIYTAIQKDNKICLVGSLATDFNTLDEQVREKLKTFSELMLDWVSDFLEEGRSTELFEFEGSSRTKAIMIVTNMLAIVQLSRLTNEQDFDTVKNSIKQDLIKK